MPVLGNVAESDTNTTLIAASANPEARATHRQLALRHFKQCGALGSTDYELSEALGILRGSASRRRGELVMRSLVCKSPLRRTTDTGSTAVVWVCIEFLESAEQEEKVSSDRDSSPPALPDCEAGR